MISDIEADQFRKTITAHIEEVYNSRYEVEGPEPGEGITELSNKRINVRQRMDRVEELLFISIRIKARVHRVRSAVKADADDAWAQAVSTSRNAPARRDWEGPRERYADADLATLSVRREERKIAELASFADEAVEVINLALRGLDSVRQDLNAAFRVVQFEDSLERRT